jgi:hypothetical protein
LIGGHVVGNAINAVAVGVGVPGGGGGVSAYGDCAVTGTEIAFNQGTYGAGFSAAGGELVLTDVAVHENAGSGFGGGGFATLAAVVLAGTTEISANTTPANGGGIWMSEASCTGGRVVGNSAESGGGIEMFRESVLTDVVIEGNTATNEGGGVTIASGGSLVGGSVSANTVTSARGVGGGILVGSAPLGPVSIDGVQVADNRADAGGGLYIVDSDVVVSGSTVIRNTATEGGGAKLSSGGTLVSADTDWGTDGDDNLPDDVYADGSIGGYGAAAAFECSVGCTPLP